MQGSGFFELSVMVFMEAFPHACRWMALLLLFDRIFSREQSDVTGQAHHSIVIRCLAQLTVVPRFIYSRSNPNRQSPNC